MSLLARRFASAFALLLSPALGCDARRAPTFSDAAVAPPPPSTTTTASPSVTPSASAAPAWEWAFDCADTSGPTSARSIGHTSIVFKVELASGKRAAWKPDAKKVRGRYRGEVAAYRLATALRLPNVPPACARTFDAAAARTAIGGSPEGARLLADEIIAEKGGIHGVIIPWIERLRFWPIEKEPLRTEVRGWLASADIPMEKIALARQASELVAFDFITGNWDRYSGANVGLDASGSRVLFIDNDAAFMERPPPQELARNRARLEATMRFSRTLVATARALDAERLRAAFGEEAPGRPLLGDSVVAGVAGRIAELLALVDARIRERGEAATLYFE